MKLNSKIGFWSKIKADVSFRPEEYTQYFEDLKLPANAEIGTIDFFESASELFADHGRQIHHPGRVTDFIVIPGEYFHHIFNYIGSGGIHS